MDSQNTVHDWASSTTMHGVKNVAGTRHRIRKIVWVILILGSVAIFLSQFIELLIRYYEYPKKTVLEISRSAINFPDITVCNMRNFDSAHIVSLAKKIQQSPRSNPEDIMHLANKGFETDYFTLLRYYWAIWVTYEKTHEELFETLFSRTNFVANLDPETVEEVGIPDWEFKLACQWGYEKCSDSNITKLFLPYFFTCMTYHAPNENLVSEGIEQGWSSVVLAGNNMVRWAQVMDKLNLPGIKEYGHPLSGNQGIRIVVHAPGSKPFPLVEGYNVPPGHSASLGIKLWQNSLLDQPHGNCTKDNPNAKERYRTLSCQRACMQKFVIQKCGCKDSTLPDPEGEEYTNTKQCAKVEPRKPEEHCLELNTVDDSCLEPLLKVFESLECIKDVKDEFSRNEPLIEACGCFPPCENDQYQITFSLTKWPAGPDIDLVYTDLFTLNDFFGKLDAEKPIPEKEHLYRNYFAQSNRATALHDFVKLSVYISDTTTIKTTEVPDYGPLQLVSALGGQLGLWVGMSVLTIAELVQFVLDLTTGCKARKTKVTAMAQPPPENSKMNMMMTDVD